MSKRAAAKDKDKEKEREKDKEKEKEKDKEKEKEKEKDKDKDKEDKEKDKEKPVAAIGAIAGIGIRRSAKGVKRKSEMNASPTKKKFKKSYALLFPRCTY